MKTLNFVLVSLGFAALLSGCGGGASSNGSTINIPTAPIQITTSSANTVAGNAYGASTTLASNGSSAGGLVGAVTQEVGALPGAYQIAMAEFERAISTPLPAATVAGAVQTQTQNCTPSGTATMTLNMAGTTFANGDSFTMSFNNCVQSGTTTNGSMSFVVNSVAGSLGTASSGSFTVTFSNLTHIDSTMNSSMNGDMSISFSKSGSTTTSTISGTSMTVVETVNSVSNGMKMTNYNISYSDDSMSGNFSYSNNMTIASTEMGGSVTITTTLPFTGNYGVNNGDPTAGSMTITGANGSSMTVTANNDGTVTVSGTDGTTPFGPNTVAWSAL